MNATTIACLFAAVLAMPAARAQAPAPSKLDPKDTEVWQPEPARVKPAAASAAPSDAVVLFDGRDLAQWTSTKTPGAAAGWTVADGAMTVRSGAGNIQTKRLFRDYQLHLEWRVPANVTGSGQGRGNSGLFLASTGPDNDGYELQILDCANNKTYVNGQTASIYKQQIPLANACAEAGQWQSYDVIWTAPRFTGDKLATPAYVTVLHNGILVQHHVPLQGETLYIGKPFYRSHGAAPIKLQDHGDAVSFRNIWVRTLGEQSATQP
jgi:hypothetical protein